MLTFTEQPSLYGLSSVIYNLVLNYQLQLSAEYQISCATFTAKFNFCKTETSSQKCKRSFRGQILSDIRIALSLRDYYERNAENYDKCNLS